MPKLDVDFCELYIYIHINVAVSCKRYPTSLPYIIIVQSCGERWDLPKFVDVLSVNLGFSRLLIWITMYYTMIRKIDSWAPGHYKIIDKLQMGFTEDLLLCP